mgnify:CR=1 FL=1
MRPPLESAWGLGAVLRGVVADMHDASKADIVSIFLYEASTHTYYAPFATGQPQESLLDSLTDMREQLARYSSDLSQGKAPDDIAVLGMGLRCRRTSSCSGSWSPALTSSPASARATRAWWAQPELQVRFRTRRGDRWDAGDSAGRGAQDSRAGGSLQRLREVRLLYRSYIDRQLPTRRLPCA